MPPKVSHIDPVLGALTDDRITTDYRVYQRLGGHRFSVDDVATAYIAARAARTPFGGPQRIADLGTGLGSVLLHLAWVFPQATLTCVEAQDASFALVCKNIERNALANRIRALHGDLRDPATIIELGAGYDLVSGTPPYFPPGTALNADDSQRTQARMETRGGVEAYIQTGTQMLAPHGVLVLCGDARAEHRVQSARGSLHIDERIDIIPKADKSALFSIWVMRPETVSAARTRVSTLTLRTAAGALTEDAIALRAFSGFGPPKNLT